MGISIAGRNGILTQAGAVMRASGHWGNIILTVTGFLWEIPTGMRNGHTFERGGLLQDFNGTGYRVMEFYNQDNLLLLNQETGSLLVAVDVKCYDRYPYAGKVSEENRETGIKWGKAVYLNPVPSQIDFKALKEEYREKRMEPAGKSMGEKIQDAVSKAGDMTAGNLGETIDRAMEVYRKSRMDGSGEMQQATRHPALNGRGR